MLGLPSAVTDANGTVTNILYDNFGRTMQTTVANSATMVYNYSNGNLSSIVRTVGGVTQYYYFTYDAFGNTTQIRVGGQILASYQYASGNGPLMKQTFANGDTVSFTYDYLGRIKTETLDDGRIVTYTYNGEGQLYSVTETGGDSPAAYYYIYDANGRLVSSEKRSASGESLMRVHIYYNAAGQLVGQIWNIGGTEYSEGYTYHSADGTLNTMTTAGQTLTMGYDALRRLETVTTAPYTKTYNYKNLTDSTTSQVTALVYNYATNITRFSYGYDGLGNIATYRDADTELITYTYDALGQLLSATGSKGSSYAYTYNNAGNILTANGHTYTYGNTIWRDLLTAYDGQSITYDASGNPLSYYNGTRWAFTWENGRSLATATDGTTSISYAYDASGLRTSKTVDGVTHYYYYASGKLLRETYGSNVLDFFYDQNGQPFAFKYNGTLYYYITNLQGDVIYVLNSSGATVASYKYDPYGNIVSVSGTMAEINPLRYRGYYFDQDTGLYYLQSRYYDPAIGRFINADVYTSTGQGVLGNNMFAYCLNNPVMYQDSNGQHAMVPPFVVNGLNLPPEGGIPVIIEGVLYYYATRFNSAGELYEFWFNANGDLVHVRHHSTHRTPSEHKNPHDHTGRRDDKGNNTQSKGPEPVDDKFQAPDKNTRDDTTSQSRFPVITFPQINLTQNVRSYGGGGGYICVDLVAGMFVGTLVGRFVITKAYDH